MAILLGTDTTMTAKQRAALKGKTGRDVPYSGSEKTQAALRIKEWENEDGLHGLTNGRSTLGLGLWKPFQDFHNTQAALAAGRGNKYEVGSFGGGSHTETTDPETGQTVIQHGGGNAMAGTRSAAPARRSAALAALGSGDPELDNMNRDLTGIDLTDAQDELQWKRLQRVADAYGNREATNYAPGTPGFNARREQIAQSENRMLDDKELSAANRFFNPRVRDKREVEQQLAVERSTAPAIAQGQFSVDRANAEGDARVAAAQAQAASRSQQSNAQIVQGFMKQIADGAKNGMFGRDRAGRPLGPPPELIAAVQQAAQGGMGEAPVGGLDPSSEAKVTRAMSEMGVDRATAIANLKRVGAIR